MLAESIRAGLDNRAGGARLRGAVRARARRRADRPLRRHVRERADLRLRRRGPRGRRRSCFAAARRSAPSRSRCGVEFVVVGRDSRRRPQRGADAGRAVRRRALRSAARRPRRDRDRRGGRAGAGARGRDRGRLLRLREPGRRGQPQRRPDGRPAGGTARERGRRDRQPPVRLRAVRGRGRLPRGRRGRRRPLRRRGRRVDEPRAARDGQARRGFPRGNQTVWDTTLGWRFPNPRLEAMFPLESMGETGENVAERWGVSREDQDAFAAESQRRWAARPTALRRRARGGGRRRAPTSTRGRRRPRRQLAR